MQCSQLYTPRHSGPCPALVHTTVSNPPYSLPCFLEVYALMLMPVLSEQGRAAVHLHLFLTTHHSQVLRLESEGACRRRGCRCGHRGRRLGLLLPDGRRLGLLRLLLQRCPPACTSAPASALTLTQLTQRRDIYSGCTRASRSMTSGHRQCSTSGAAK